MGLLRNLRSRARRLRERIERLRSGDDGPEPEEGLRDRRLGRLPREEEADPKVESSPGLGRLRSNAVRLLEDADVQPEESGRQIITSVATRWEAALADDVALLTD